MASHLLHRVFEHALESLYLFYSVIGSFLLGNYANCNEGTVSTKASASIFGFYGYNQTWFLSSAR